MGKGSSLRAKVERSTGTISAIGNNGGPDGGPPFRLNETKFLSRLYISLLAVFGIGLFLAFRYLLPLPSSVVRIPLYLVLAVGGGPLVWNILRKLLAGDFGSDALAGISILVSLVMGEFLVGSILVLMLSGGETLEQFAARRASAVLRALARRMPQVAHRKNGGEIVNVKIAEVALGDRLVIFPHEICPVDGVVIEGRGTMDESYLTGEPFEISKSLGSQVLSGAINGDGALVIRTQKLAADSRYAGIMRVMEEAERNRPQLRRLGDQIAAWYTPAALTLAALAWGLSGNAERFLAVLVVATPCPLLIAIPVAVIGAISLAAGRSIIIKNPTVLEQITRCRTIILDKTGTLTYGKPSLTEIVTTPKFERNDVLRAAASLEQYSRHPLAGAIMKAASQARLELGFVSEIDEKPGAGLSGNVDGRRVTVTGRNRIDPKKHDLPPTASGLECLVFIDSIFAAAFRFRDAPQPESKSFLAHLPHTHQVSKLMLLSGDRDSEVRYLAEKVGISEIASGKSPEEKVRIVSDEVKKGKTLFIGDGINDAPALAVATVGIAIGKNGNIAAEAADAVIMTTSIGKLDELIHIGHRMRIIALESAIGGMALSAIGMLLAAFGWLPPLEGAITQEIIDLAAVLNAVRVAIPPRKLTDF